MVIKKVTFNKKFINISTASLLMLFHLIMLVIDKDYSTDRYINIGIATGSLVYMSIMKSKYDFIIFSIIGFLITAFGTPGNFSGIVFYFMALFDCKHPVNVIINVANIVTALVFKLYSNNYFDANIFSTIVAFYFTFSHMYIRFWGIAEVKEIKHNKGLTVEQMDAIRMLIRGYKHQDAADILGIERGTFTARVKGLRKRYNVKNDFQLSLWLIKEDIIGINDITNVKMHDNYPPKG